MGVNTGTGGGEEDGAGGAHSRHTTADRLRRALAPVADHFAELAEAHQRHARPVRVGCERGDSEIVADADAALARLQAEVARSGRHGGDAWTALDAARRALGGGHT